MPKILITLLLVGLFLGACQKETPLFSLLSADKTNIKFKNSIAIKDSSNILDQEFIYNGGGVAVGDFNADGLQDVFFTGNQVQNKLYVNKGDLKFEDVSDKAGLIKPNLNIWSSGAVVVDINGDGKLDIYVCNTMAPKAENRRNFLYVNQGNDTNGNPQFKNLASQYGIDDDSHSANAIFFDYDNDGDLDLYVAVNLIDTPYPNQFITRQDNGQSETTDRLYRNDLNRGGTFVNVSKAAGIRFHGYTHGVSVADINQDGWQDIYATNDYQTTDNLLINNHDGTFGNQIGEAFKHLSASAMGQDIADIDNDGRLDCITMEMLPTANQRRKTMQGSNSYNRYLLTEQYHYEYQFFRNTLQWNRGNNPNTGLPVFSEVGLMAGVSATDWSWTPLWVDFDNDGLKDLMVTNGFPKDVTDNDFALFRASINSMLTTPEELLNMLPEVKIANFVFKNNGKLSFEDKSKAWGITQPSFSNGAAYADFDNDGDIDFVVNNIDSEASFYKNNLNEINKNSKKNNGNFLNIKLLGTKQNPQSLGAKMTIWQQGQQQLIENAVVRGYLSSSENIAHFGLSANPIVDSVIVDWAEGKQIKLYKPKPNKTLVLNINQGQTRLQKTIKSQTSFLAEIESKSLGISYVHEENDFIDFNLQKTLPHKFSQYGPGIAVGDVNGDGIDDFVTGGSSRFDAMIFTQNANGKFSQKALNIKTGDHKKEEDLGILLFDADADGDNDLYFVRGSYQHDYNSDLYQDVLMVNDGKGNFKKDSLALPKMTACGQAVKAADFDKDGDLDLFVGGRVKPKAYPQTDRSYILRNDSKTKDKPVFKEITNEVCPILSSIGMVTDALWSDYDNNGSIDLILTGEFMPITFLKNTKGKFSKDSRTQNLDQALGWWNSITAADFDNDGDTDYVVGNFGKNLLFTGTSQEPLYVYAKDFDKNGLYDPFMACYCPDNKGDRRLYCYHSRDDMIKQMVLIRKKYKKFSEFGNAQMEAMFTKEEMKDAQIVKATEFNTSYLENKGNGQFEIRTMPMQTQVAPVYGMLPYDLDNDGRIDLLMIGNDYGIEVFSGRADAFYGLALLNKPNGWQPLDIEKSGFFVPGDARALTRIIKANGKEMLIATQNKAAFRFFEKPNQDGQLIKLGAKDQTKTLILANGKKRKLEFYYGSSFLSQESRQLMIPKGAILK